MFLFINSAKEEMISPEFVCADVCVLQRKKAQKVINIVYEIWWREPTS